MWIARNPNHPEAPLHPGEMLREEFMGPLGVSCEALASAMGVSAARVAGIVAERRGISKDTARRLGKHFGMSTKFWMNLQSNYESAVAYASNRQRPKWPLTVCTILSE
jgi:addiction module HigA family antidote